MSDIKIISICKGCDTIYDNDKEHTKPCCPDMNYQDWILEEYANQQTQSLQKQVEIEEQQNEMLIETLEQYKSEIVVLEHENDLQQEHLMHNEAELIPLRKSYQKLQSDYTKLKEAADEMETNLKEYIIGEHDKIKIVKALENYKQLTNLKQVNEGMVCCGRCNEHNDECGEKNYIFKK